MTNKDYPQSNGSQPSVNLKNGINNDAMSVSSYKGSKDILNAKFNKPPEKANSTVTNTQPVSYFKLVSSRQDWNLAISAECGCPHNRSVILTD